MSLKQYALKIGNELLRVKGLVNSKGWLEWRDKDGSSGLAKPGSFCPWINRRDQFPNIEDRK